MLPYSEAQSPTGHHIPLTHPRVSPPALTSHDRVNASFPVTGSTSLPSCPMLRPLAIELGLITLADAIAIPFWSGVVPSVLKRNLVEGPEPVPVELATVYQEPVTVGVESEVNM